MKHSQTEAMFRIIVEPIFYKKLSGKTGWSVNVFDKEVFVLGPTSDNYAREWAMEELDNMLCEYESDIKPCIDEMISAQYAPSMGISGPRLSRPKHLSLALDGNAVYEIWGRLKCEGESYWTDCGEEYDTSCTIMESNVSILDPESAKDCRASEETDDEPLDADQPVL